GLDNLASHYSDTGPPKGEIVVLVAPEEDTAENFDQEAIDTLLQGELTTRRVKDAAAAVAKRTGLMRRDLYNRALRLREEE
nr:16S rRNA (cytidine(1402)-2'-O)-methyltransferase [Alphaproteobacteria bacterium]